MNRKGERTLEREIEKESGRDIDIQKEIRWIG